VRQSRYKNTPPFAALIDVTFALASDVYIGTNRTKKSPAHVSGGAEFRALALLPSLKVQGALLVLFGEEDALAGSFWRT
jgi:hypothetical protein